MDNLQANQTVTNVRTEGVKAGAPVQADVLLNGGLGKEALSRAEV